MQEKKSKIIVLIPCYREEEHIAAVVRDFIAAGMSVTVIDDGSPDHTAERAKEAGANVLVHPQNRGKGAAMTTGIEYARQQGCDAVVFADGDGQHLPAEVTRFVECFRKTNADLIIGTRMADTKTMPLIRLLTNRFMNRVLSRRIGQVLTGTQCGYRLLSKRAFSCQTDTEFSGFAADSEVILRAAKAGLKMAEVPVSTVYGTEKSKIHPVRDTILFFRLLHRFR